MSVVTLAVTVQEAVESVSGEGSLLTVTLE